MIDELLKDSGITFEELNPEERDTLLEWTNDLQQGILTVEKIREYIVDMADAVTLELSDIELSEEKDRFLKARLRNYLLIKAFLSTPEKAREMIESRIEALKIKRGA